MIKLAFIFPGQGSHFVGMSKTLYDNYALVKRTYEEAGDVLGFDISKMSFTGSLLELNKPQNMFPAILVSGVAAYRAYMHDFGLAPQMCAGHSLGEYTALTCSGAIMFKDAVRITHLRGKLAQEVGDIGRMTIINNINCNTVESECMRLTETGQSVSVSCYNSPTQTAVSGLNEAVTKLEDKVLEMGGYINPLMDCAPFHCPLMQKVSENLIVELEKYKYNYIRYPVISNATGIPYKDCDEIKANLKNQIINPVRWDYTVDYMHKRGITHVIEMGPKKFLSNILRMNTDKIECFCLEEKKDREYLEKLILGDEKIYNHIPNLVTKCLAAAVATPNLNWDNNEYSEGVLKSYKKIQDIQDLLDKDLVKPTNEQMKEALMLLKVIFDTKKLALNEQFEWFEQIIDETGTRYEFDGLDFY